MIRQEHLLNYRKDIEHKTSSKNNNGLGSLLKEREKFSSTITKMQWERQSHLYFTARPKTSATMSMPVRWKDLSSTFPTDFTILNGFDIVKKSDDC